MSGNCSVSIVPATTTSQTGSSIPPQRIARLFWQVVGEPVKGLHPRPPQLFWKILINEESNPDDTLDVEKYFWSPFN